MTRSTPKKLVLSLSLALTAFSAVLAEGNKTHVNWATFNVRLDTKADSLNRWDYRKDTVADYIRRNQIDIIGMQETLANQIDDLVEALPNYGYVGVCREDGDRKGEATPIFFRTDRFEVLESNTFWLSQYPDSVGFIGWDGACTRIATWAKLRNKDNGQVFMAVNTHFDHIGKEARRNAALLIVDRMKKIVADEPVVLTGDFNVNDESEPYRIITSGDLAMFDSYKEAATTSGPSYSWHDYGRCPIEKRDKIDFIFVTKGVEVLSSHILQEHEYNPEKPETRWGYVSDHNPIIAELEF